MDPAPETFEIRETNPAADNHDDMLQFLFDKLQQPDATILLGPTVVLDFRKPRPLSR